LAKRAAPPAAADAIFKNVLRLTRFSDIFKISRIPNNTFIIKSQKWVG
jgi:hypothetical protein